jgi:hypothetical protein
MLTVTAPQSDCTWNITYRSSWIQMDLSTGGTGSARIPITVSPGTAPRAGLIVLNQAQYSVYFVQNPILNCGCRPRSPVDRSSTGCTVGVAPDGFVPPVAILQADFSSLGGQKHGFLYYVYTTGGTTWDMDAYDLPAPGTYDIPVSWISPNTGQTWTSTVCHLPVVGG